MIIALKIDVDTERGTQEGVPNLLDLFQELHIPAAFLFSLGPDNTGRAIKRIFRPGFLKKVSRSNVIGIYGLKTLFNGVLWPGPLIAKRHHNIMRKARQQGHETGIHCYDHIRWQDNVHKMTREQVFQEFHKARAAFFEVFQTPALTAGAAGWQANENSLAAYDEADLLYASDARGEYPFFPRINQRIFKTLQIPTTLPALDELLGRKEYPESKLINFYINLLKSDQYNIYTMHSEIEGMAKLAWFRQFLMALISEGAVFKKMEDIARELLSSSDKLPVCDFVQGRVEGRSGTLSVQNA